MTGRTKRAREQQRLALLAVRAVKRLFVNGEPTFEERMAWLAGRKAGVRAERKRLKAELRLLHIQVIDLSKQLEPFRGAHGAPLNPDQVARREMWRAESNFQQRIKR